MGLLTASSGGIVNSVLDELRKLRLHLRANFRPPEPVWNVPSAYRALKLYRADELDRRVLLPTSRRISVAEAVERWHLDRIEL
jgi:hypothetical protein